MNSAIASVLANWSSIFRIINDVGASLSLFPPPCPPRPLRAPTLVRRILKPPHPLLPPLASSHSSPPTSRGFSRRVGRPRGRTSRRGRRAGRRAAAPSRPARDAGGRVKVRVQQARCMIGNEDSCCRMYDIISMVHFHHRGERERGCTQVQDAYLNSSRDGPVDRHILVSALLW